MSDVYLKAWHGGLGDALQFSTLPEEFENNKEEKHILLQMHLLEMKVSMT